jgi:vitamin B12 transporter
MNALFPLLLNMFLSGSWFIKWNVCLLVSGLCLGFTALSAQQDTTTVLDEIQVTAQRINLSGIGKHSDVIDSQALNIRQYNSLSGVLSIQTPLYVRSYGSGTLATLGIRGGSAAHTQLLWNGIPLRNPMIGLVDLALIPSFFTDEVAVHYGGHGAAFGSGAIGGLISFANSTLTEDDQLSLNLSAGSWGFWLGEGTFNYGFKKLRFSTRLFGQTAENNYRYKLDDDLPERNQVHNEIKNAGLLQEMHWNIKEREHLTARLWYQETDRQIPPLSTQTTSKSAQQDDNLRMSVQWSRQGEKVTWQLKSAWMDERIDYQDTLIELYTHNEFRTWLAEAETSFRLAPSINFTGGLYTEAVKANSANYDTNTLRYQHAGFMSIAFIHDDWVWRYQMREEVTDDQWSPLLVDLSTEWSGIRHFTLKTSISRNYRVPTLNDLYWRPGGNPDLIPEEGWTAEAGIHYAAPGKKVGFHSSLTAYARTIDQWIMWMPPVKDVRNYWSPINIAEVHSRGMEARANVKITEKNWSFDFNAGLDLTWSTFGGPLPEFMIEEGDQLFYIPVENLQAGVKILNDHWSGHYYHHWFGSSPGINEMVESGNVGTAGVNYHFSGAKLKWTLYLQADNVWNVPYRLIERRPMPGRSFMGGVRFSFT